MGVLMLLAIGCGEGEASSSAEGGTGTTGTASTAVEVSSDGASTEAETVATSSTDTGEPQCPPGSAEADLFGAPPAIDVASQLVAPIDIQMIEAEIVLDVAAQAGTGNATMVFRTGPEAAHPAFDLRQTITSAELDGRPLDPAADLPLTVVDGGPTSGEMRVLSSALDPCTEHTLTLSYAVEEPSVFGPVAPQYAADGVTWSITSLDTGVAARFLEQWVPANLVFDRFALTLDLGLDGTDRAHTFAANGTVEEIDPQHWHVEYPDNFTAASFMWLLAPQDELDTYVETVSLPDGMDVEIESYARSAWAIDLPAKVAVVADVFRETVISTGSYVHGDKFLIGYVRITIPNMEYAGGTEMFPDEDISLEHEAFHSWFARGLDPVSQVDGWIDEGWTTYTINYGGTAPEFAPDDPPWQLVAQNPWGRFPMPIDADDTYAVYASVFGTLAAEVGADTLAALMADYWNANAPGFMSTTDLERFLYCESTNPNVLSIFHRWVYGRDGDPDPPPDDYCG